MEGRISPPIRPQPTSSANCRKIGGSRMRTRLRSSWRGVRWRAMARSRQEFSRNSETCIDRDLGRKFHLSGALRHWIVLEFAFGNKEVGDGECGRMMIGELPSSNIGSNEFCEHRVTRYQLDICRMVSVGCHLHFHYPLYACPSFLTRRRDVGALEGSYRGQGRRVLLSNG